MRRTLRSLLRHPASSLAAIVTGAIGIALLTLALAVADAARARALPFANAADVLVLHTRLASPREVRERVRWSFARLSYVREHATTLERVTSWTAATLTLGIGERPETVRGEIVSRDYFALLGVAPVAGRTFAPDEDVAGAPRAVAIVSDALRRRQRLAGVAIDVGSVLRLNEREVTVVGVLPAGFRGLTDAAELWLPAPMAPLVTYPEYLTTDQNFITLLARARRGSSTTLPARARGDSSVMLLARTRGSGSMDQVQREVAMLAAASDRAAPSEDSGPDVTIGGFAEPVGAVRVRAEGRRAATLAVAGATLLFALTLANLVALLLARMVAHRRETAVLLALGASAARVRWERAREGALLVGAAAVLALAGIAAWLAVAGPLDPLANVGRGTLGTFSAVTLDWRVAAWWGVTSLATTAIVAGIPAAWALRHARPGHLREGAHASADTGASLRRPGWVAAILVLEGALAVLLVSAAGHLLESYRRLQRANVGVEPEHVLTFELHPSERNVPPAAAPAFIARVLDAVREVPGVVSASVDGGAPLVGSANTTLHVVGRAGDAGEPPVVLRHYVGPEHFTTLGIPLRAGRTFTGADRAGAPPVAVISESAARRFFPAGDAIGSRVWFGGSAFTSPDSSVEIVGIVGDVKYDSPLRERTTASFYTPYAQFSYGWRVYFVRVRGEPRAMQRPIADAVHRAAPGLPVREMRPLEDVLASSRAAPRRAARGTTALAVLGLVLAACGIWAVVSHVTAQRARDMAIRMAHGATPARVVRHVLADGLAWPVVGLVLGGAGAAAASRVLRALLYGVTPGDPRILAGTAVLFLLAAVAACLAPAWRASRAGLVSLLRAD